MARIIAQLISWLAGKVVVYVVILALLLAIFVVMVVPSMVVKYHEKELEKAIAELSDSRALVGELAERAKGIGAEIDQRTKQLRELDEKRRAMEDLWEIPRQCAIEAFAASGCRSGFVKTFEKAIFPEGCGFPGNVKDEDVEASELKQEQATSVGGYRQLKYADLTLESGKNTVTKLLGGMAAKYNDFSFPRQ